MASRKKLPPGPEPRFLDGLTSPIRRDPLTFMTRAARQYGDIVGFRFLYVRTYLLVHPADIEDVLVTNARKFVKGRALRANKHLFGEGLLTSEGELWLRQRRLMQPAFHRARIAAYAGTMTDFAVRLMEGWKNGEQIDVHREMMRLTLQVVGKTLFDSDVERDAPQVGKTLDLLLEFASDFRRLIFTPKWLPTARNLQAKRAIRLLDEIIFRIIREKRTSEKDTGDLLSMLLSVRDEDGSRMNDQQLRDETITLFLAGHETTASALSWTWWLLAQHSQVETKLHAELQEVLGGRLPLMEDLPRLTYTGHVLTESMRLYPPAWAMARMAIEDHEISGYPVPRGTGIAASQWIVHRDPRWYDAPGKFLPERWEGDLLKRIPRLAYFPFGAGSRQCIGNAFAVMEATLVLATIAQRYRFQLVEGHSVVPLASITLRPRYGVKVIVEERGRKHHA
jgi:cytochrome P450